MADFQDVVNELKKTNQKLDEIGKASDPKGAGATEDKRDEERARNEQTALLRGILGALSGGSGGAGVAEDKKAGGMFGGIARVLGGMGAGIGRGIGGFMAGMAAGAVFAVPFVIAMGALGAGLAAFGILIAGAGWVVSQMMPDIADGLKAFDGIDGVHLMEVGGGIAALGGGFAVMGLGTAISGVGNLIGSLADGLLGLFGKESTEQDLIGKLKKFSELDLDPVAIGRNARAMVAYGRAMAAGGAGKILEGLGDFVSGTFGALGRALGAVPVIDKLKAFGEVRVNYDNVVNNSAAMGEYAIAMAKAAGAQGIGALGEFANFVGESFKSLSGLIGGKGMIENAIANMQTMSSTTGINVENIKKFSEALGAFGIAMTKATGQSAIKMIGEMANFVGEGFKALSKLVGGQGMLESAISGMQLMSQDHGINKANMEKIAEAMGAFNVVMLKAMKTAGISAGAEFLNFVGQGFKALSEVIGGKGVLQSTLDGMKLISSYNVNDIDKDKIAKVGEAVGTYGVAMNSVAKAAGGKLLADLANFASTAINAFTEFIGGDADSIKVTIEGMKNMSNYELAEINVEKIENLGKAFSVYGTAMNSAASANANTAWDDITSLASGITSTIKGWFTDDQDPMEMLRAFAKTSITKNELKQLQENAAAFEMYGRAVGSMGDLNKLFTNGDTPDLKAFAIKLNESTDPLIAATAKLSSPALTKQFTNAGKNLGTFFDAFRNIEGMGSDYFMGSSDIHDFSEDLVNALDNFEKAGPVVGQVLVSQKAQRNAEQIAAAAGGGGGVNAVSNVDARSNVSSVSVDAIPLGHPDRIAAMAASASD